MLSRSSNNTAQEVVSVNQHNTISGIRKDGTFSGNHSPRFLGHSPDCQLKRDDFSQSNLFVENTKNIVNLMKSVRNVISQKNSAFNSKLQNANFSRHHQMRGNHSRSLKTSVIDPNDGFPYNTDGFPTTEEITLRTRDCTFEDTSVSPNSRLECRTSQN